MKLAAKKNKILSAIMTCVLAVTLMAGFPAVKAYAASGTVYSCTINRCYAHPVTGVIEDSGGEGSYATGQGMVNSCVYSNGILEVTDDGAYYLTIRMGLMDYTSGHSFQVQNVGDSGWSTPSEIGITGNGSDSNGTADVCMRVPSENCVVRGSMYVEPMGRDVIFYLYPSNYSEGNNTDMNATMVTESSDGTAVESSDNSGSVDNSGSTSSGNSSLGSGNSSLQSSSSSDKSSSSSSSKKLESSIKEAAKPSSDSSSLDTENPVNSSEGLSLSTAKDGTSDSDSDSGNTSSGNRIFQIALAVVVAGLILLGAVSGVIYFFRKNWKRWGGAEDDDE